MSGCPKDPDRGCGCDNGFESEADVDPCSRGSCREWGSRFPKGMSKPPLEPQVAKFRWKVRTVFAASLVSILGVGFLYGQYLRYKTSREAAKEKKDKNKSKLVNYDHFKAIGPTSLFLPENKELNVERNREMKTGDNKTSEAGNDTLISSDVNEGKAVNKIETIGMPTDIKQESLTDSGPDKVPTAGVLVLPNAISDGNYNPIAYYKGVIRETVNTAVSKIWSFIGITNDLPTSTADVQLVPASDFTGMAGGADRNGMGEEVADTVPPSAEKQDVPVEDVEGPIGSPREVINEPIRGAVPTQVSSSGVKKVKNNLEFTKKPQIPKRELLKAVIPSKLHSTEMNKETIKVVKVDKTDVNRTDPLQLIETPKNERKAVITVVTAGKEGRKVKRRGWR